MLQVNLKGKCNDDDDGIGYFPDAKESISPTFYMSNLWLQNFRSFLAHCFWHKCKQCKVLQPSRIFYQLQPNHVLKFQYKCW